MMAANDPSRLKCRYLGAKTLHASTSHTFPGGLLSQSLPPEAAYSLVVVVRSSSSSSSVPSEPASSPPLVCFPIAGAGGRLAVLQGPGRKWEVKEQGKGEGIISSVIGGGQITGVVPWAGKNGIVTAAEDGKVRAYAFAADGLKADRAEADLCFSAHNGRILLLAAHPELARCLVTAANEVNGFVVKVWDLDDQAEVVALPSEHAVLAVAWHERQLLVAGRSAENATLLTSWNTTDKTGTCTVKLHEGSRACRLIVTDEHLFSIGYGKGNMREIAILSVKELAKGVLALVPIDVSPAVLLPHFDPLTNLLFLAGRGDTMILPFEYKADKAPYLHACPTFATNGVQQGLYFVSHNELNVKDVEVARCYRLIDGKVELLTWQIPRAKKDFFQDDLYNDIPVITNPSLSISDWLIHGKAIQRDVMTVQPAGMQKLSEAPKADAPAPKKFASFGSEEARKQEEKNRLFQRMFAEAKADGESEDTSAKAAQEEEENSDWD